jgi:hypothetical protein
LLVILIIAFLAKAAMFILELLKKSNIWGYYRSVFLHIAAQFRNKYKFKSLRNGFI